MSDISGDLIFKWYWTPRINLEEQPILMVIKVLMKLIIKNYEEIKRHFIFTRLTATKQYNIQYLLNDQACEVL